MSAQHPVGERCGGDESQSQSSRMRGSRLSFFFFFCLCFACQFKKNPTELREEAVDVIELTRQSWRGRERAKEEEE